MSRANFLDFSSEVNPLPPPLAPQGLKTSTKNKPNLNYLTNYLISKEDFLDLSYREE